jgi:hypothetical protein
MGLKSSIGKIVEAAIVTVGDLAETIAYNQKASTSYDVTTGVVTTTDTVYTFQAIVSPFGAAGTGSNEILDGITSDLAILFASNDLVVTPDTNDTITRNSKEYKVKQIIQDPAGASYRLIVGLLG